MPKLLNKEGEKEKMFLITGQEPMALQMMANPIILDQQPAGTDEGWDLMILEGLHTRQTKQNKKQKTIWETKAEASLLTASQSQPSWQLLRLDKSTT